MSVSQALTRVKNYISHFWTPDPRQEGTEGSSRNRLHQGVFGGIGTSRKRQAGSVFEPEITDDEDDLGVPSFQSYQPFFKRPRSELDVDMSRDNYVFRSSGPPPNVEGEKRQPWEFDFENFHIKKPKSSKPNPLLRIAGPSTSKYAMEFGRDSKMMENPNPFGSQHVAAGTSRSEERVEVITLEDDVDSAGIEGSSKKKYSKLSSRSKEVVPIKSRLSSPMKRAKNRDSNVFTKCLSNIGKRLAGNHSSAIRIEEMQQYKKLLMAYNVFGNNETHSFYKNSALTKSKVHQQELQAIYNKCGASPSAATVSLRYGGRALPSTFTTPAINSANCKPTKSLLPLPHLYSTPCNYLTASAIQSPPKRLAIHPTPEVVDLELEAPKNIKDTFPSPITPVTSRRSDVSLSLSPSKGLGIYSNLEEALNNSTAILDELGDSEQLAIEAPEDSTSKSETGTEVEEDEDISIIAERVVNKSRSKLVNTLALEQTSCRFVDKQWLDESKSTWRENKKHIEDRIREEAQTISILRRESTLDKELEEKIRKKLTLTEYIILEEPPLEIPELTDEILAVIRHAKARGNDNEVLAQVRLPKDTISITRGDVKTLGPSQWLNDNVINTYMGLIVLRSKMDNYPSVYAFQTFFYPKLLKEGYSNSLKRWTRKDDIFAHDLIILPIHLGLHWCLSCIDLRKKTICYFDSLGGDNNKCLYSLLEYISKEMKERKQLDLDKSEWKLVNVKGIPQQQNGSDCGMFACKFAEYLSRDSDFSFSQENMPYFRDRMIYELVRSDLMHP